MSRVLSQAELPRHTLAYAQFMHILRVFKFFLSQGIRYRSKCPFLFFFQLRDQKLTNLKGLYLIDFTEHCQEAEQDEFLQET